MTCSPSRDKTISVKIAAISAQGLINTRAAEKNQGFY
jgi:hypothetical protein